jgi:LysM repeat protein
VTALFLGLVLAGGLATLLASTSQAASPAPAPAVVVVQPGDTLWSLAARHLPSRDPYGMIEEIRRLNDLSDHTLHPGQKLVLP